jgi:hypothetical protein
MTKNVFDLVTAVVTGLEVIADGIFAYLGVTGRMDAKTATAVAGSITIGGNAVLGTCARFIKDEKKE